MGFIARTIFWLGLVYSAMPLDFGSLIPGQVAALTGDNPLAPCVRGVAEDCRRRVGELRKALDTAVALGLADRSGPGDRGGGGEGSGPSAEGSGSGAKGLGRPAAPTAAIVAPADAAGHGRPRFAILASSFEVL